MTSQPDHPPHGQFADGAQIVDTRLTPAGWTALIFWPHDQFGNPRHHPWCVCDLHHYPEHTTDAGWVRSSSRWAYTRSEAEQLFTGTAAA